MAAPLQTERNRPGPLAVVAILLGFLIFGAATLWIRHQPRGRTDLETDRARERSERLAKLREVETKALAEYTWIDRSNSVIGLPIEHAIALTLPALQQKPVRAAGIIPPPVPTNAPPVLATNLPASSQPTPPPAPTNAPPPAPVPPPPGTNAPPQPPIPPQPATAAFLETPRLSADGRLSP